MKEGLRLFLAIGLPEPVRETLFRVQAQLEKQLPASTVRWVRQEQMHLTLRFLGETAVSQLPAVQAHLTELASQHLPFKLQLEGLGAFPNRKRPRVIWVSLAGDLLQLQALQANLENRVVAMGWPRAKRPFRPHLTLGRVQSSKNLPGVRWNTEVDKVEFFVNAVTLMQSELRPSGAVYTVLQEAQLNPNI